MRKRAAVVAVPLLFVAVSCDGGGDKSAEVAAEVTAEASVEADETDEAATNEPAVDEPVADEPMVDDAATDEPATDEPATDEPATAEDDSTQENGDEAGDGDAAEFTGDAGSEWCVAAREVETLSEQLESDTLNFADPAAVESAYSGFVVAIDEAVTVAPPEIAADVATTARGFRLLSDALASVEWNFLDADLSVIDDLDAEMTAAGDRIGNYNEQVCGIAQDDDDEIESADEATDFDPGAGTPREQMAAGLVTVGFTADEANCIVEQVDIATYLETNDDQLILDAFDACEIPLARLAELTGG